MPPRRQSRAFTSVGGLSSGPAEGRNPLGLAMVDGIRFFGPKNATRQTADSGPGRGEGKGGGKRPPRHAGPTGRPPPGRLWVCFGPSTRFNSRGPAMKKNLATGPGPPPEMRVGKQKKKKNQKAAGETPMTLKSLGLAGPIAVYHVPASFPLLPTISFAMFRCRHQR